MAQEPSGIYKDIKALQSNILVLSKKIKYLMHNEKILGRNILIINKKISKGKEAQNNSLGNIDNEKIQEILNKQEKIEKDLNNLKHTLEVFSKRYAKIDDVNEMKYVIDNINPLEYTTVDQVKKIIKEKENK